MVCDEYQQAWWGSWWPWAEANQGLLSVIALVTALVLFLLEQKRANKAEQAAKDAAIDAERKEREKLRIQKIEARAQAMAEKRRRVSEFVAATVDVFDGFIAHGQAAIEQQIGGGNFFAIWPETDGALRAMQATCPPDPALLRLLHRAIARIEAASRYDSGRSGKNAEMYVESVATDLRAIEEALRARKRELAKFWE